MTLSIHTRKCFIKCTQRNRFSIVVLVDVSVARRFSFFLKEFLRATTLQNQNNIFSTPGRVEKKEEKRLQRKSCKDAEPREKIRRQDPFVLYLESILMGSHFLSFEAKGAKGESFTCTNCMLWKIACPMSFLCKKKKKRLQMFAHSKKNN